MPRHIFQKLFHAVFFNSPDLRGTNPQKTENELPLSCFLMSAVILPLGSETRQRPPMNLAFPQSSHPGIFKRTDSPPLPRPFFLDRGPPRGMVSVLFCPFLGYAALLRLSYGLTPAPVLSSFFFSTPKRLSPFISSLPFLTDQRSTMMVSGVSVMDFFSIFHSPVGYALHL